MSPPVTVRSNRSGSARKNKKMQWFVGFAPSAWQRRSGRSGIGTWRGREARGTVTPGKQQATYARGPGCAAARARCGQSRCLSLLAPRARARLRLGRRSCDGARGGSPRCAASRCQLIPQGSASGCRGGGCAPRASLGVRRRPRWTMKTSTTSLATTSAQTPTTTRTRRCGGSGCGSACVRVRALLCARASERAPLRHGADAGGVLHAERPRTLARAHS